MRDLSRPGDIRRSNERSAVRVMASILALGALMAAPFVLRDLAVLPFNLRW